MSNDTRGKLIEAATNLFSEHGYAAVTTKEIAKLAGVSEVTLFRHFESKRILFNTIIKENMMNFGIESYIQNEATFDVRRDLTEIASRIVASKKDNRSLQKMVLKDKFMHSEAHTHTQKIENTDMKALRSYFKTLKEKNLINDSPEKLSRFFISNINGFAFHNFIMKPYSEEMEKEQSEYFNWLITKVIDIILM